ncbi:hypothetical protein MMC10_004250 [Thelotrema lepadinum]|nr:hypothetical protein [Thelotrema lepadinum]
MGRFSQLPLKEVPLRRQTVFTSLGLYIIPIAFLSSVTIIHYTGRKFDYVFSRFTIGLLLIFLLQRVLWAWCNLFKIAYLGWSYGYSHVHRALYTLFFSLTWTTILAGGCIALPGMWMEWAVFERVPAVFFALLHYAALCDFLWVVSLVVKYGPSQFQSPLAYIDIPWPSVNGLGVPLPVKRKTPLLYPGIIGILRHSGWRFISWLLIGCIGLEVVIIFQPLSPMLEEKNVFYSLVLALDATLFALFGWAIFVIICYPKHRADAVSRAACCIAMVANLCILSTSTYLLLMFIEETSPSRTIVPQRHLSIAKYCQYMSVMSLLVFALVWNTVERHRWRSSYYDRHLMMDGSTDTFGECTNLSLREKMLLFVRRISGGYLELNRIKPRARKTPKSQPDSSSRGKILPLLRRTFKSRRRDKTIDFAICVTGLLILGITLLLLCVSLGSKKPHINVAAHLIGISIVSAVIAATLCLALLRLRSVEHPIEKLARRQSTLVPNIVDARRDSIPAMDAFTFERGSLYSTPRYDRSPVNLSGATTPTKASDGSRRSSAIANPEAATVTERDFAPQTDTTRAKSAGPTRRSTTFATEAPPPPPRKPTTKSTRPSTINESEPSQPSHSSATNPTQIPPHTPAAPAPPKRKQTVTFALDGSATHDHSSPSGNSTEWESAESTLDPEPPEPAHHPIQHSRSKTVAFDGPIEDSYEGLFPPREHYNPIRLSSIGNGMKTVRLPRRAPRPSVLFGARRPEERVEQQQGRRAGGGGGLIGDDEGIEMGCISRGV